MGENLRIFIKFAIGVFKNVQIHQIWIQNAWIYTNLNLEPSNPIKFDFNMLEFA